MAEMLAEMLCVCVCMTRQRQQATANVGHDVAREEHTNKSERTHKHAHRKNGVGGGEGGTRTRCGWLHWLYVTPHDCRCPVRPFFCVYKNQDKLRARSVFLEFILLFCIVVRAVRLMMQFGLWFGEL